MLAYGVCGKVCVIYYTFDPRINDLFVAALYYDKLIFDVYI